MQLQTFSYLDENTVFRSVASPEYYSSWVVAMKTNAHDLKFLEGPELQWELLSWVVPENELIITC